MMQLVSSEKFLEEHDGSLEQVFDSFSKYLNLISLNCADTGDFKISMFETVLNESYDYAVRLNFITLLFDFAI